MCTLSDYLWNWITLIDPIWVVLKSKVYKRDKCGNILQISMNIGCGIEYHWSIGLFCVVILTDKCVISISMCTNCLFTELCTLWTSV